MPEMNKGLTIDLDDPELIEALAAGMWGNDPERGPWANASDYWRAGYRDLAERAVAVLRGGHFG